jgi:anti-sigma regulatory factor (Ser/Thr protein kinase)
VLVYAAAHGRVLEAAMRTEEHRMGRSSVAKSFARETNSVPQARHWAKRVYADAGVDEELVELCGLLVSEAVTNAVRHSAGKEFTVVVLPDLWIEVWDEEPELAPFRRVVALDSEGGRGLQLMEMCAPGWQVLETTDGKAVRFLPKGW